MSPDRALAWLELALAVPTFVALDFVSAPYGRHGRAGWGPTVPERLGWMAMESPASLFFAAVYATGARCADLVPLVLLALWQVHYLNRAFLYPLRLRPGARMPLAVAGLAVAFAPRALAHHRWYKERFPDYPRERRALVPFVL